MPIAQETSAQVTRAQVKRLALLLAILLLGALLYQPASASKEFAAVEKANTAYADENYNQAIALYTEAIDQGLENPHLYYNLANAYHQNGQLGRAIGYYRLALQLAPRDPDIRANMAETRATLGNIAPPSQAKDFVTTVSLARKNFGLRELQLGFLYSFTALWLLFLLQPLYSNALRPWWLYPLPAVVCLITGFSLFFLAENPDGSFRLHLPLLQEAHPPVVITVDTTARSGAGEEHTAVLTLEEGLAVAQLGKEGSWVKVQSPTARIAWVPEARVIELQP